MLNTLFKDPYWLFCWGLLPVFSYVLYSYLRWRDRRLTLLGPFANRLVQGFSRRQYLIRGWLWMVSIFLLVVVMANPHWGTRKVQQSQKAVDVMFALDISRSMLSEDLRPNRLVRSRLFAQELLQGLEGNRVGLLFFAGDAFLSMPPSTDYSTLTSLISEADPEGFSAQGTSIESVVDLAIQAFDPSKSAVRALVIITDGEEHEGDPASVISAARDEHGIQTFVVGAGTLEGGTIPVYGGGVQRDADGEVVISKMNNLLLEEIAKAGGSESPYYILNQVDAISSIVKEIAALPSKEISIRQYDTENSLYQWFLFPAFLMLFWEFYWFKKRVG
ncbi:MAG: VWA domain-containing protein [Chitinophagales bacterium]|jgi:Ca-activated chloride channel family protein